MLYVSVNGQLHVCAVFRRRKSLTGRGAGPGTSNGSGSVARAWRLRSVSTCIDELLPTSAPHHSVSCDPPDRLARSRPDAGTRPAVCAGPTGTALYACVSVCGLERSTCDMAPRVARRRPRALGKGIFVVAMWNLETGFLCSETGREP